MHDVYEAALAAFAARVANQAGEWDRVSHVPADACAEFLELCEHIELQRLCEVLGESRSLGVLLRLLGPMLASEAALAAHAPVAGGTVTSSAPWFAAKASSIERRDGGYVVSGSCRAVVAAAHCDELWVWGGGRQYALVPLAAAGIRCQPCCEELPAAELTTVHLDEVQLTTDRVVELSDVAFEQLRVRHLGLLARALARFSYVLLDSTLAFVGSRSFRGGVLSDAPAVRHRLAELRVFPELFSAQTEQAARGGEEQPLRTLLLAETLSESLPTFIKLCQQLHGGRGFLMESCVARAYRDVLELPCLLGPRAQLRRSAGARLSELARLRDASVVFASAEHQAFRSRVRALIARSITAERERWELDAMSVGALHAAFAQERVTTIRLERDFAYSFILAEELMAAAPAGVAVSLMIAAGAVVPLLAREASAELRDAIWPSIVAGSAILAFGVTEPEGGSDLLHSLQTRAVDVGDAWIINGKKLFITNGPLASHVLVLARTSDQPGPFHSSFIVVSTDTPGVRVSAPYQTLGLRASPTGWVEFRDVRVPKHHVVGRVGLGMSLLAASISEERTLIAAGVLALARRLVCEALACYADDGVLPSGQFSAPDQLLSALARLDALRSLALACAQGIVDGEQNNAAAGLVKFAASEAAQQAIELATDALSARAGQAPAHCQRALRDTRVFSVFAGTNETLRELVGASMAAAARSRLSRGGSP